MLQQVYNADEAAVYFDITSKTTVNAKRESL